MENNKCFSLTNIVTFIVLFCYIFAFYIGGISVSLLLFIPFAIYAVLNKNYFISILKVITSNYIRSVLKWWMILLILSLFYPILYLTFDYSFFSLVATQILHFIAAFPVLAYFEYTHCTLNKLEKIIIYIFVLQTLIQLVVVSNDTLGNLILSFNHFEPEKVLGIGSNIRGKALSAATTYHLSLVYGICFILYIKRMLIEKVIMKNALIGLFIFVGIFFAGRSGFVGCLFGLICYYFSSNIGIGNKGRLILYWILSIIVALFLSSLFFPTIYGLFANAVLPYAFEFFYSLSETGKMETASTNELQNGWLNTDFNYIEFFMGSGQYTYPDGTYYMHVDPGILRNTLFMGIIGYLVLCCYQLQLLPVWKLKGKEKYYYGVILLYLFVMEFKGVTIGVNKFAFAITLLLGYISLNTSKIKN